MITSKVTLINIPRDPLDIISEAGLTSTQGLPRAIEATSLKTTEQLIAFTKKLISLGHTSVLEHIAFTFSIEDVSRVTETQILRHRLASYTVQSGRYSELSLNVKLPPSIEEANQYNPRISQNLVNLQLILDKVIGSLQDAEIPNEDIRYLLPQGSFTSMYITMNLRELRHFINLRSCEAAQWEIRSIARTLYKLIEDLSEEYKTLLYDCEPRCNSCDRLRDGTCSGTNPSKWHYEMPSS